MSAEQKSITTGPASAAFVAAGVGCAALGLFTTLAEASVRIKDLLNWRDPVGPLSGKTSVAVIIWLVAWLVLHQAWKNKSVSFARSFTVTLALIALGAIGTFPTFFQLFSH